MNKEEKSLHERYNLEVKPVGSSIRHMFLLYIYQGTWLKYYIGISTDGFDNCQTFTISSAYVLTVLPLTISKRILSYIFYKLANNKSQLVIDVNKDYIKKIKALFIPYIREDLKITTSEYISTNESKMALMIIPLDREKMDYLYNEMYKNNLHDVDKIQEPQDKQSSLSPCSKKEEEVVEPKIKEIEIDIVETEETLLKSGYDFVNPNTSNPFLINNARASRDHDRAFNNLFTRGSFAYAPRINIRKKEF